MNASQISAFTAATGIPPIFLKDVIALIIAMIIFLWFAWLLMGLFKGWKRKDVDFHDFIWGTARGAVLVLFITYFIR